MILSENIFNYEVTFLKDEKIYNNVKNATDKILSSNRRYYIKKNLDRNQQLFSMTQKS